MGNQNSKRQSPKGSSRPLAAETVPASHVSNNPYNRADDKNKHDDSVTLHNSKGDPYANMGLSSLSGSSSESVNGSGNDQEKGSSLPPSFSTHHNRSLHEASREEGGGESNGNHSSNPSPATLLTTSPRKTSSASCDSNPVQVDASVASGMILPSHGPDSSEKRLSSLISGDLIQPPPLAHTQDHHHNQCLYQQQHQQRSMGQTTMGPSPQVNGKNGHASLGDLKPQTVASEPTVDSTMEKGIGKDAEKDTKRQHFDHIKDNVINSSDSPDNSNDDYEDTLINGHDDQQQAHRHDKGHVNSKVNDAQSEHHLEDSPNQQHEDLSVSPSPEPCVPFAVLEPGQPILVKRPTLIPLTIPASGTSTPRSPLPHSPISAGQNKSPELSPTTRIPFLGSSSDKGSKIMDIDDMISRLLDAGYSGKIAKNICLRNNEIVYICQNAREVFLSQPTLIELNAPVKIVGDIHGQYTDMLRMFEMCGFPPSANFLFLGDYVDRGKMSLETILLLFCYKIKYPENFFLLRGNHECANVTKVYGFYDECKRRASVKMWKAFVDVFNCLPLAAIVANKIFCVHGGLSPSLGTMDDIRALRRPTDVPDYGLLNDLLWSDPSDTALDWEDNERGVSYCFGRSIIQKFLHKHDFDLVCRAHMVVEDGYEFFNERTLVTVFSAPNYCGEFDNFGAVMSVSEELLCSFELLKPIDQATARAQMQSLAATNGGWRVNKQRLRETISKIVGSKAAEEAEAVADASPSKNWDYSITFQGAKGVPRGDILSSDPFLEAYLGSSEDPEALSFVTGVEWNTLNPVWNATWKLVNVADNTDLEMHVKDKDKMKDDTPLGKVILKLNSRLEGTQEHVLDLVRADGRTHGQVLVQTIASKTVGKAATLTKASTNGPARYSRHTSYAAGALTRENKFEFYTYRIRLYHLLDVFGSDPRQYQHWNEDYDNAKRIFADSLEGLNIRNALHSQHSYLYRHGRTTVYGALETASDLGKLLHGERLKADANHDLKMIVFTYSIIRKGLYFSETGAAFFQDFMSKHAMHANRANEVMYSGEFRLFMDENHHGDWTLLIDNNSGTYAPKKKDLHKVREAFQLNFPDLVVIALDHEDDYLKEIRAETKRIEAEQAAQQKQRFSLFASMSPKTEEVALEA
ncbi:hypothetical protein BGZ50_001855 [Haplosporangium sp. Z 11]|nr:hypothetical protein BGZ50_001855 [Haplosporangium sp. Z 11]